MSGGNESVAPVGTQSLIQHCWSTLRFCHDIVVLLRQLAHVLTSPELLTLLLCLFHVVKLWVFSCTGASLLLHDVLFPSFEPPSVCWSPLSHSDNHDGQLQVCAGQNQQGRKTNRTIKKSLYSKTCIEVNPSLCHVSLPFIFGHLHTDSVGQQNIKGKSYDIK